MEDVYFKLGNSEIPILLLWGDQDKIVPYGASSRMVELLPRARFVPLSGFGHADHFCEAYQIFKREVQEFL